MKRHFLYLFLVASFFMNAQETKSLLWEISGEHLEKPSYLYGTMHVSGKIAFRLDDVFFESLQKSDFVALESDPSFWLDHYLKDDSFNQIFGLGENQAKGFYRNNFRFEAPKKDLISAYLAMEDGLVNSILFRSNKVSQEFEEETYLDMFIFQAGKKLNKPIVSLEDIDESSQLTSIAAKNANKEKPDAWLQKKLLEESYPKLLQDAYRERNIALIDSLDRGLYTDHYLKNMLFIRNENMVEQLEIAMKKGTVFAGIGAAHLPGKKGVIQMLRDLGYTVKPLISEKTETGSQLKEQLENIVYENKYQTQSVADGMFSISLPDKFYPIYSDINTTYISPDLANGAFMIVNRIRTFSNLINEGLEYDLDLIDELLFENIPGKIITKKRIKNGNYDGFDIINKLKKGDYQRYQIFITPLEIIMFKMGGKGEYVKNHSDTIFNSLTFKPIDNNKTTIAGHFNDFHVSLPKFNSFSNKNSKGNKLLEAYDSDAEEYFFVRRATLNDLLYIEEDAFELKQIQKRFYEELELDLPLYDAYNEEELSLQSYAQLKKLKKNLYLKTILKGANYYLLGCVSSKKIVAQSFFDSFKLNTFSYEKPFVKTQDTSLYFSTVTNIKPPKNVGSNHPDDSFYDKDKKSYQEFYKSAIYTNNNNETIEVTLYKPHDYEMFSNLDSIWNYRKRSYEDGTFNTHFSSREKNKFGDDEFNLVLKDTNSTRAIKVKNIYKNGVIYELFTLTELDKTPSEFVNTFYDNFKPNDTTMARSLFTNKTGDFFEKLRQNDSVVFSAYNQLLYKKADLDTMKYYISEFQYPEDKLFIKNRLISSLAYRKDTDASEFFKRLYIGSYENSYAQVEILRSLAFKKDKKSLDFFLELLSKDLPLTKNNYEINRTFKRLGKERYLNRAKLMFPKLLEFTIVNDYKKPIFSLLAKLKQEDVIKEKVYKKYKNQIINDAKIELKRFLSKNVKSYYSSYNSSKKVKKGNTLLHDYIVLLFPFRNEKNVKPFFDRLAQVQDEQIITILIGLKAKNKEWVSKDLLNGLAQNINSRILLFKQLKNVDRLDLFPFAYKTQQSIAQASLYSDYKFDRTKDSVVFVKKKDMVIKGKDITAFVFKTKSKQGYNTDWKLNVLAFENKGEITTDIYQESEDIKISEAVEFDELVEKSLEKIELKSRERAIVKFKNYNDYSGF